MATATLPWKQLLLNAIESNPHLKHSSFFQLSTVGSSGRPSNRTLVFRGFEEISDRILINTDSRTRKIEDLKYNHCPFAEQRERAWFATSFKSRLQFLGPNPVRPCLTEQSLQESPLDKFFRPSCFILSTNHRSITG